MANNDDLKNRGEKRTPLMQRLGDLPDTLRIDRREWPRTQEPGMVPSGGAGTTNPGLGISPDISSAPSVAGIDVPRPISKRVQTVYDALPVNATAINILGNGIVDGAGNCDNMSISYQVPAAKILVVRSVSVFLAYTSAGVPNVTQGDLISEASTADVVVTVYFDIIVNGGPQGIVTFPSNSNTSLQNTLSRWPLTFENFPCFVIGGPNTTVTFLYKAFNTGSLPNVIVKLEMQGQLLQSHGVPANFEIAEG